jgi:hypothetical protein
MAPESFQGSSVIVNPFRQAGFGRVKPMLLVKAPFKYMQNTYNKLLTSENPSNPVKVGQTGSNLFHGSQTHGELKFGGCAQSKPSSGAS